MSLAYLGKVNASGRGSDPVKPLSGLALKQAYLVQVGFVPDNDRSWSVR